ncbi:hypothetical protein LWI29_028914 [Acer saccharum]|uniref:Reverse transcriptase domain-containing protein n=1 Tax=Acer saccharum TaxID=4024 RepID=A0AA39T6R9_ACESA|nr:hypothetical protein LWI29_028914 [Acer saccharum]
MQVDESKLSRRTTMLTGFSGEQKSTLGEIVLPVYAEGVNLYINFLVLDCQSPYNAILGRPWIHELKAIPSTYHQLIKFPTKWGVKEIKGEQRAARECYQNGFKKEETGIIAITGSQGRVDSNQAKNGGTRRGATYQRLVNKMFAKMLGSTMEVYIDDMLVKSLVAQQHNDHQRQSFDVLDQYGMKLNPTKCSFGVSSGKFLGYLVTQRGVEANPDQIRSIENIESPKCIKDVQKLTGRVAALNRFISKSSEKCLPFFNILRKNKAFEWNDDCEKALQELKNYLKSPPLLSKPKDNETLFIYLAVSDTAIVQS